MNAIIFDLDGTLWNSSAQVAESWNIAIANNYPEISFIFDENSLQKCMGLTMTEIADLWFPEIERKKRYELLEIMCRFEVEYLYDHPGDLWPQELEVLKALAEKYDLYIASNCQAGYIEAFMAGTHTGKYFKGSICFGDTGLGKSENLKKLVDDNALTNAVMIGDTDKDRTAAHFAGIPFIHAAYGFGVVGEADGVVYSFAELENEIERLLIRLGCRNRRTIHF